MKISKVIQELEGVKKVYGEIEVQLQNHPKIGEQVVGNGSFWIAPEEYEDDEVICNIRDWPY